jgi:hypothetical protein
MKIATPTACARCKSKYWNIQPTRKTKRTIAKNGNKIDKFREDDKLELFGHDMLTLKRFLARESKHKKQRKLIEEAEKHLAMVKQHIAEHEKREGIK